MNHQEFEDSEKPLAIVFSGNDKVTCSDIFEDEEDVALGAERFAAGMKDEWVTTWIANKKARAIMAKRRVKQLFG